MKTILYIIILFVGSIIDIKKRIVPKYINILTMCLCVITFEIHLTGLILPIILLFLTLVGINIGGGDIKFIGATSLVFGLIKTLKIFVLATFIMCLFSISLSLANKIRVKKRECLALPFLPFLLISFIIINF